MKLTRLNQLMVDDEGIDGKWRLNGNHELEYREKGREKKVKLKASLIAAEPDALVAAVTLKEKDGRLITQTAKLSGTWHLNEKNQIVFDIERQFGKKDILTFKSAWHVGKFHEIIYAYENKSLKTKTTELQTLTFKGVWDITEKNRLTYLLEGDTESAFVIRGTFQTKSILAKEGEIRYQFGIEAEGKQRLETITLFGKWKLSRALELSFEMEYEKGRRRTMAFGAEYRLNDRTEIEAQLKSRQGEPLGLELVLSRSFLQNEGGAFLRLRKTLQESSLEAGIKIPW